MRFHSGMGRSARRGTRVGSVIGLMLLLGAVMEALAGEPATVKLWNWNIHDKKYQQKMYKLFNQRNPDIRIDYTSISSTVYAQVLEAAIIAKEAPDIFMPEGKFTFGYLRANGLIMPLSDLPPNAQELKDWMAQFPPQLQKFVEGVNVFDGKPYSFNLNGVPYNGCPLFYNKTLFKEAGIEKPPATYADFRHTAAKITQAGQGKFFGIVHGLRNRQILDYDIDESLAHAGGVRGILWGGPDRRDGKYHYGSPEYINAVKVWVGMREDGSVFPGETNIDDEQAKMSFATNKAALQFGGWWNPGNYLAYNPDSDFDVVLSPTPDGVWKGYYVNWGGLGGAFGYVVSSQVTHPRAAWEVIKFLSSLEFQEGYVQGGFGISYMPEANKRENFTVPQMYKFVQWAQDPAMVHVLPPTSRDAMRVYEFVSGVYPPYADVLENVYLGKAGFDALDDFDKRLNAAFEEGLKKAQAAGVKVSMGDFVFPDWDPGKDYVPKKK